MEISISLLKRIRQFCILIQKGATLSHQLTWSHYQELLSINDMNKINYYIDQITKRNISVHKLRNIIKNQEYERLPEGTKQKLIKKEELTIKDEIKNPIYLPMNKVPDKISEKLIHKLILENLELFLEQLGDGYTYIKHEYPIKIGNRNNYIDFLLFNIKYNSYVVVEVKITELKKEHIGQIQTYMNYIDNNIKSVFQNNTLGILIVKEDNKFITMYCNNNNITRTTFKLK